MPPAKPGADGLRIQARELVIRIPAPDNPSSRIRCASAPSDFGTASGAIRPPPAPRSPAAPARAEPVLSPESRRKTPLRPKQGAPRKPWGPRAPRRHEPGVMRISGRPDRRSGASRAGPLRPPCPAPCPALMSKPARRREGRFVDEFPAGGVSKGQTPPARTPRRRSRRASGACARPRARPTWRGRRAGGSTPRSRRPAGGRRQTKPQSAASSIRAGVSIPSTPVAGSRKTTCSTPAVRSPSASRCWRAAPGRHSASTAARTASLTRR